MYQNNHTYQGGAYPQNFYEGHQGQFTQEANSFSNHDTDEVNSFPNHQATVSSNCGCSGNTPHVQQQFYGEVVPQWMQNGQQWMQQHPDWMQNGQQWMQQHPNWMQNGTDWMQNGQQWMQQHPNWMQNGMDSAQQWWQSQPGSYMPKTYNTPHAQSNGFEAQQTTQEFNHTQADNN